MVSVTPSSFGKMATTTDTTSEAVGNDQVLFSLLIDARYFPLVILKKGSFLYRCYFFNQTPYLR